MKRLCKTVVIAMCIFSFLSLFGCNKNKHIVDGPGMERELWQEFTISRCSELYEPIYSYTVKYDCTSDETYLYSDASGIAEESTGIQLKEKTTDALFSLGILTLPDEESVTGRFRTLSVVDAKGQRIHKRLSTAKEAEILALIEPYVEASNVDDGDKNAHILDGPGMARVPEWVSFTISQTSDVYEGNFAYTVAKDEQDGLYYLSYDYFDYENKVPDERKVQLEKQTVASLLAMKLLSLPDEVTKESSGEEMILDGTWAKLTITDDFGDTYKKSVSDDMVQAIRSLLTPYVVDEL